MAAFKCQRHVDQSMCPCSANSCTKQPVQETNTGSKHVSARMCHHRLVFRYRPFRTIGLERRCDTLCLPLDATAPDHAARRHGCTPSFRLLAFPRVLVLCHGTRSRSRVTAAHLSACAWMVRLESALARPARSFDAIQERTAVITNARPRTSLRTRTRTQTLLLHVVAECQRCGAR